MSSTHSATGIGDNWWVETPSPFWHRVIQALEARGHRVTQADIAKSLGVGQTAVSKWARGAGLPTPARLIALADYCQVPLQWLLSGKGDMDVRGLQDKQLRQLLEVWEDLSGDQRKTIVRVAQGLHEPEADEPDDEEPDQD